MPSVDLRPRTLQCVRCGAQATLADHEVETEDYPDKDMVRALTALPEGWFALRLATLAEDADALAELEAQAEAIGAQADAALAQGVPETQVSAQVDQALATIEAAADALPLIIADQLVVLCPAEQTYLDEITDADMDDEFDDLEDDDDDEA